MNIWDQGREACDKHNTARRLKKTTKPHWEREIELHMSFDRLQAPAATAGYNERIAELQSQGAVA